MTAIITKTVSKKVLANRAARRDRDASRYAAVVSALAPTEIAYEIDEKGRKVRVTPASDADIAYLLRGNRALDSFDLWEGIGKEATAKLIANGSLARDPKWSKYKTGNLYWITEKAAELYGIPATWQNDLGTFRLQPAN